VVGSRQVAPRDPNFSSVSLLLHMNGTNGSNTFTDSSLNNFSVTAVGNAQISNTQSKFGGTSAYFDGAGDGLSLSSNAAFGFGTGVFTAELFLFLTANGIAGGTVIFDFRTGLTGTPWTFYVKNTGSGNGLGMYYATGTSYVEWLAAGQYLSLNQWYHVALVRDGSVYKAFLEGTQLTVSGGNASAVDLGTPKPLTIGIAADNSTAPITGYIDELRITKGVTRYTTNFTPPSSPFPDQ